MKSVFAKLHPAIYSVVCYVKSRVQKEYITILAVLDTGSSSTMVDKEFALHCKMPIKSGPTIKDVNYVDRQASYEVYEVEIDIFSQDRKFHQPIIAETVENFTKSCYLLNWAEELVKYPFMKNLNVPNAPYPPLGVLLIGVDNAHLFETLEKRRGSSKDDPLANRTPLGWAFMGKRKDPSPLIENRSFFNHEFKSQDDFLEQLVIRQFTLDTFGLQEKESPFAKGFSGGPRPPASWSPIEKAADDKMIITQKGSTFEATIPWKGDHEVRLCDNFRPVYLRQLNTHTEYALSKKEIKIEEIDAIIDGYVAKGYIESVPDSEKATGWYLPFFEVVNRHKSTPIRLVFDAKAEYKKISLNNQILDTPNRLNDLVSILLRLRQYQFAITGDISEMFLRVHMDQKDRKYHRFVHKEQHFQWTRILFGNKSSPNISQKVLSTLSDAYREKYPQACETLDKFCYMDDCVDSTPTESELAILANDLPALLKLADMRLCKLYTNSKNVAKLIPTDLLAKEVKFEDKDPVFDSNKVLGMTWCANVDKLVFSTKYKTVQEWKEACSVTTWTKRAVLKTTASTFDPLGLVSPIIVYPRTIIQELWSKKLDWDDPIELCDCEKWEQGLKNILEVPKLEFNRWIQDRPNSGIELHVFCDSSERAYAAAVYSRVNSDGGEIVTNLVMTKARVSPLKNESIPRLELIACVIGTRLLTAVNLTYKVPQEKIFYYTDSRNALYWINTPAHKAKTYVYNRSAEIQRVSEPSQWSHVATDVNPADIATRIVSTDDLKSNKIWFEGPPFLRDKNYVFSKFVPDIKDLSPEVEKELKSNSELVFQQLEVAIKNMWQHKVDRLSVGKLYNNLERFRKLLRLMIGGICKWRKHIMSTYEINLRSNYVLYILSQKESFKTEFSILNQGKKLFSTNQLAKLNPFIDPFGVIRSNSRLSDLDYLPEDTKRPVILLGSNQITRAIVLEVHWQKSHTVSENLVRSTLHQKFIILGLTKLLKVITSKCFVCRKTKGQPSSQIMSPLRDRLGIPNRIFAETGLDFAGPFEIIQGRGKTRRNRFVLVLTCLQTRAVHFEPTFDQTAVSVVNAIDRFCRVRGRPRYLVSDNQTSFKKADKALRDFTLLVEHNKDLIEAQVNSSTEYEPLIWEFITPRAPHFGGAWEIMVKAMKRALTALGQSQPLDDDTFVTFLCRAMDLINQRPLLKHFSQETPHILTPNDFIMGRIDTSIYPFKVTPEETRLGARWRQLEEITTQLWQRFVSEILPELAPRQKWKARFNNLEPGTVVLVIETGLPRGVWKTGIVISTELSRDGFVRSAQVKVGDKTYDRPISKLIPLIEE